MRADEHEGDLSSADVKRQADQMNARAREIVSSDLLDLTEAEVFLRWFGRYVVPALTQDFPTSNAPELAKFMGRRGLILSIVEEMDVASPGFLRRVLAVREKYDNDLRLAAQKEQ